MLQQWPGWRRQATTRVTAEQLLQGWDPRKHRRVTRAEATIPGVIVGAPSPTRSWAKAAARRPGQISDIDAFGLGCGDPERKSSPAGPQQQGPFRQRGRR